MQDLHIARAHVATHVLARVETHVLVQTVDCNVLARVVKHVLARVETHVLARVLLHMLDYNSKTCLPNGPKTYIVANIATDTRVL